MYIYIVSAVGFPFISFHQWDLFGDMKFIGFQNYVDFFQDATGRKVFINTVVFTLIAVPIQLVMAFFLAVALNQKIRGVRFFRGAYFMPAIASMVSVSIVWQWLFNTDFGMVNYVIELLGGAKLNWLTNPNLSLWTIIIVSCWKGLGYNMVIFLAGLQGIPATYYEAAELDGCTGLARLARITFPLLKPTTLYVSITCVINSMQVFDQVMIITGAARQGLPRYWSSIFMKMHLIIITWDTPARLAGSWQFLSLCWRQFSSGLWAAMITVWNEPSWRT